VRDAAVAPLASAAVDLFDQQWAVYRHVLEADLMEHAALTAATAAALRHWLSSRPRSARPPTMIDLGCGDLALLPSVLRQLPLASYRGLDLSASVLRLAVAAMGEAPFPCHWQEGDALEWAASATAEQPIDLIHSAFVLHHLNAEEKALFLSQARRHLAPGGMFLWADVFRLPGESREDYLKRYVQRIRESWHFLDGGDRERVIAHLRNFDDPADVSLIVSTARQAGWSMKWLWQGRHRAEALAVLTPSRWEESAGPDSEGMHQHC
jgi:SAM-dependent methyltransferase